MTKVSVYIGSSIRLGPTSLLATRCQKKTFAFQAIENSVVCVSVSPKIHLGRRNGRAGECPTHSFSIHYIMTSSCNVAPRRLARSAFSTPQHNRIPVSEPPSMIRIPILQAQYSNPRGEALFRCCSCYSPRCMGGRLCAARVRPRCFVRPHTEPE